MRNFRVAAVLMIIHGGLMELGAFLALIPLLVLGTERETVSEYFSFIVPYLQDNLYLMMAMSGVFGVVRIIGAIGLLKNRMWGLALSLINCGCDDGAHDLYAARGPRRRCARGRRPRADSDGLLRQVTHQSVRVRNLWFRRA